MGEIQGGYRVDLTYTSGAVTCDDKIGTSQLSSETQGVLTRGSLSSGNDWVFLNNAGLQSFDSRITLRVADKRPEEDRCFVGGRLRGRADLRDCRRPDGKPLFATDSDGGPLISAWKQGFVEGSFLPLILAVSFDVPTSGFPKSQDETYDHCRELERGPLIGFGRATFASGNHSPIVAIALDIYRLTDRTFEVSGGGARGRAPASGQTQTAAGG